LIVLAGLAAPASADVRVTGRIQKPVSGIDVGRFANPGLPPDPVVPRILACARGLGSGRPDPMGMLRVGLRVAASGEVEGVEVTAEATEPGKSAPPATIVGCVREALAAIRVDRVQDARPISLVGRYYFRSDDRLQVFGRLREVPR
jgi:hypothetical protein